MAGALRGPAVATGLSLLKLLRYLAREFLLIVSTSSSETALPRLIAKMEHLAVAVAVLDGEDPFDELTLDPAEYDHDHGHHGQHDGYGAPEHAGAHVAADGRPAEPVDAAASPTEPAPSVDPPRTGRP